ELSDARFVRRAQGGTGPNHAQRRGSVLGTARIAAHGLYAGLRSENLRTDHGHLPRPGARHALGRREQSWGGLWDCVVKPSSASFVSLSCSYSYSYSMNYT